MSRARRLRGHESCCSADNIDSSGRGGEYWDRPYTIDARWQAHLAGPMTKAEEDAVYLIEGGRLWETDSIGNRYADPKLSGLPSAAYDTYKRREVAALAVIANGGGELNRVRDPSPMPLEWYSTNGTAANKALREKHAKEGYAGVNAGLDSNGIPWTHRGETLWCKPCSSTGEDFRNELEKTGLEMVPVGRGIAMALSYIPVWGTAVSFMLNTSISLALGEDLDDSVMDGIGGALPGQPASGMAFNAVRSIAKGDRLDKTLIQLLPLDQYEKDLLWAAVQIVEAIAEGDKITPIIMNTIYSQLPPAGKKAMDLARRVANGEKLADIAKSEGKEYLDQQFAAIEEQVDSIKKNIRDLGEQVEALKSLTLQAGYQASVDTLSDDTRAALTAGVIAGKAQREKTKLERGGFDNTEKNVELHNDWAAKGQAIARTGIYQNVLDRTVIPVPLADIRAGKYPLSINHTERWDSLTGKTLKENWTEVLRIDSDQKRRGFDIGLGFYEGKTAEDPTHPRVLAELNNEHMKSGFEYAKVVQMARTKQTEFEKNLNKVAVAAAVNISEPDRFDIENFASKGAVIAKVDPKVAAARNLNSDGRYRWGFDVGSGVTQGMSAPGPGQSAWRAKLGPTFNGGGIKRGEIGSVQAMQAFDVAQALQHGISKEREKIATNARQANYGTTPAERSGALIVAGLSGSSSSADTKARVVAQTLGNPDVSAGATKAIVQKQGFFNRLLSLFGL